MDHPVDTLWLPPGASIGSFSLACPASDALLLQGLDMGTAGAWPGANKALYVAFDLQAPATAKKISWVNGGTVSGNVDVGIYDVNGRRLVSSGSVAQTPVSSIQAADITDTALKPGIYYVAMVLDNATGQVFRGQPNALLLTACEVLREESAFPLPATATFVTTGTAFLPLVAVNFAATV